MAIQKVLFALVWLCSVAIAADKNFFPLQDVRPGLRGIGKTVFQGDRIEDFQVEILGVLEDFGPRQPIILARLSGGPLAATGILQGMSGSPVYVDGKLLGAVALGFPFSKEPIAGIQPIQAIIDGTIGGGPDTGRSEQGSILNSSAKLAGGLDSLLQLLSLASSINTRVPLFGEISEILNPLSISGANSHTVTHMDAGLNHFGLSAIEKVSQRVAGSQNNSQPAASSRKFNIADLKPGSMISVGLITGDWNMTADGTVTYIDGKNLYAFGHRFLNIGNAEMPFAFSDVLALIPNVNSSFKISSPREWVGTIVNDHATGIAGEIGRAAHTIPLEINVTSGTTGNHGYHLRIVNDRLLTPFLAQTALFSTLDATERTIGAGTLKLQGEVEFEGNLPPLRVHDIYVSDSGLTQQASADAVVTLAFVLGGGFRDAHVKGMHYTLDQVASKRQLRLTQAWASTHDVKPGDALKITALLEADNGFEVTKALSYRVPVGMQTGPLNITLSDANSVNFADFAGISQSQFRTATDMIESVNRYRDSGSLYVRIWRQQPAFNVSGPMPGGELSDPPPSVVLVLTDTASSTSSGMTQLAKGSDVAQMSIAMDGFVVTGAKTIQLEVKE